jgi:hypothetical protein
MSPTGLGEFDAVRDPAARKWMQCSFRTTWFDGGARSGAQAIKKTGRSA